jgi:hypothetical protein
MHIHPANPGSHQTVRLDEHQCIIVVDDRGLREVGQEGENLCPSPKVAAGDLANDEGVADYFRLE